MATPSGVIPNLMTELAGRLAGLSISPLPPEASPMLIRFGFATLVGAIEGVGDSMAVQRISERILKRSIMTVSRNACMPTASEIVWRSDGNYSHYDLFVKHGCA